MFRFQKNRKVIVDPIAEKLKAPSPKLEEQARQLRRPKQETPVNSLQYRNAIMTDEAPSAEFETLEFYQSDDSAILDFLTLLGLDHRCYDSVTISLENNKPLKLSISAYALKDVTYGSTLRPKNLGD